MVVIRKFRTRFGCLSFITYTLCCCTSSSNMMSAAKSSTQTPRTTINEHLSSTRKTRSASFAQSQRRRGQKNRRFCLPVVNGGDDITIIQNEIIKEAEPLLSQSSSFSDSLLEAGIEPWQLYFGFFAGIAPFHHRRVRVRETDFNPTQVRFVPRLRAD